MRKTANSVLQNAAQHLGKTLQKLPTESNFQETVHYIELTRRDRELQILLYSIARIERSEAEPDEAVIIIELRHRVWNLHERCRSELQSTAN